jgi:hypothetical protein
MPYAPVQTSQDYLGGRTAPTGIMRKIRPALDRGMPYRTWAMQDADFREHTFQDVGE